MAVNEYKEWLANFCKSYIGMPLAVKNNPIRPVYIYPDQSDSLGNKVCGLIITSGLKTKEWSSSFEEIKANAVVIPPMETMLNLLETASWCGYSARRVYNKGWSPTIVKAKDLDGGVYKRTLVPCLYDKDLELTYGVFSGEALKFLPFGAALSSLNKGDRVSAAIAKKLAIGLLKGYKLPVVYFEGDIIGIVDSEHKVKLTKEFLRFKELFYKRWGVSVDVLESKQVDKFPYEIALDLSEVPPAAPPVRGDDLRAGDVIRGRHMVDTETYRWRRSLMNNNVILRDILVQDDWVPLDEVNPHEFANWQQLEILRAVRPQPPDPGHIFNAANAWREGINRAEQQRGQDPFRFIQPVAPNRARRG